VGSIPFESSSENLAISMVAGFLCFGKGIRNFKIGSYLVLIIIEKG